MSILVLVEFGLAAIFHTFSVIRILQLMYMKVKHSKEISTFLMTLLINWLIVSLLIIPYEIHGVLTWRLNENDKSRSGYFLYFIAMPCHIFLGMIPVSVFFLTLDRICIIKFAHNYGRQKRVNLFKIYVFTLITGSVVIGTGFFLAYFQLPNPTDCSIYGCILGEYVLVYLSWRALCALFNIAGGIVFFVLLYKSNQNVENKIWISPNNQSKIGNNSKNLITTLAIVTEFFLSFLPHFGPFIWEALFGVGSSMGTGPLSEFMSSLEVTLLALTYSKVMKNHGERSSKSNVSAIRLNRACQVRPQSNISNIAGRNNLLNVNTGF